MSYYRLRRGGPTCPPEPKPEQRPDQRPDQQPEEQHSDINMGSGGHTGPPLPSTPSDQPPEEWPRRKFIRLKGYDYSQPGYYFVTICVQHKECLFCTIRDGKPVLNEVGRMIEQWYYRMEEKFAYLRCDAMVVMPNHFHCLFEIRRGGTRAAGRGGPTCPPEQRPEEINMGSGGHIGPPVQGCTCPPEQRPEEINMGSGGHMGPPVQVGTCPPEQRPEEINMGSGGHMGPPLQCDASVPGVVRWFKTMTTNEYIRMVKAGRARPLYRRLWQRNYWEHIVRDRQDYDNIKNYIVTNPLRWHEDALHAKE